MNEDSIRPDSLRPDLAAAAQRDRLWLLTHDAEFVYVDCPVCDTSTGVKVWHIIDGFWYRRCSDCGTLYISPRPTQELLNAYYARSEIAQCWCEQIYSVIPPLGGGEKTRGGAMSLGEVLQSAGVVAGFFGLVCVCSDPHGPLPTIAIVGLVIFALGLIFQSDRSPWRRW